MIPTTITSRYSLSMNQISQLSERQAQELICGLRWTKTSGKPVCPKCNSDRTIPTGHYQPFRCDSCFTVYSETSSTIFNHNRLPLSVIVFAAVVYMRMRRQSNIERYGKMIGVSRGSARLLYRRFEEIMEKSPIPSNCPRDHEPLFLLHAGLNHPVSKWKSYSGRVGANLKSYQVSS